MAVDRETTLRKAEKLLRQGKLDAAIAEYQRVIEDQPRDWNTANMLGDLYVRAGQLDKAVAQYTRIADHLAREGFLPKAAALFKKIIKIKPGDEYSLLQSGEICAQQGLLVDAKAYLSAVAGLRTSHGDRRGAAEIRVRLGNLDPADLDARLAGARAAAELGQASASATTLKEIAAELFQRGRPESEAQALDFLREAAGLDPADEETRRRLVRAHVARGEMDRAREYATSGAQFKEIASELEEAGKPDLALAALVEAARLDPEDVETQARLARAFAGRGDLDRARTYLTPEVASSDPDLLFTLGEIELRGGRMEEGQELLSRLLAADPGRRDQLILLGCALSEANAEAGFRCIDLAADAALAEHDWAAAAAAMHEFVTRVPNHIPALMKLVEVCVDGGLEATMYSAQAQLADAYLTAGSGAEARVIAEDLVAREPWDRANIERFRRALTMLGETDPDSLIAERLSGQSPFISTDLFADIGEPAPGGAAAAGGSGEPTSPAPGPAEHFVIASSPFEPSAPAVIPEEPLMSDRSSRPPAGPPPQGPQKETKRPKSPEDVYELSPDAIDLASILGPENKGDKDEKDAGRRASQGGSGASVEIDLSGALEDLKGFAGGDPTGSKPSPESRERLEGPEGPEGKEARDLRGVFKDFRDEVTRQASADVAAQHFKLAATYREMGLIDECIKALEVAVRSPHLRFEAASMLGRLYLERAMSAQAIEWFERAAEAPAPTAEAGRALLYELGNTLEGAGETARALAVFLELQADAGEYRDVAARLERLSRVQTRG